MASRDKKPGDLGPYWVTSDYQSPPDKSLAEAQWRKAELLLHSKPYKIDVAIAWWEHQERVTKLLLLLVILVLAVPGLNGLVNPGRRQREPARSIASQTANQAIVEKIVATGLVTEAEFDGTVLRVVVPDSWYLLGPTRKRQLVAALVAIVRPGDAQPAIIVNVFDGALRKVAGYNAFHGIYIDR